METCQTSGAIVWLTDFVLVFSWEFLTKRKNVESSKLYHSLKGTHQHLHLTLCLCPPVSAQMSSVGITENVKGDSKKFEVWYNGREEVYIIQVCWWGRMRQSSLSVYSSTFLKENTGDVCFSLSILVHTTTPLHSFVRCSQNYKNRR